MNKKKLIVTWGIIAIFFCLYFRILESMAIMEIPQEELIKFRIRIECDEIDKHTSLIENAKSYRHVIINDYKSGRKWGNSFTVAYFDGNELKKITYNIAFETNIRDMKYYFKEGKLIYVFKKVTIPIKDPITNEETGEETHFWFDNGKFIGAFKEKLPKRGYFRDHKNEQLPELEYIPPDSELKEILEEANNLIVKIKEKRK